MGKSNGKEKRARELFAKEVQEEKANKGWEYNRNLLETSLDSLITIGPDGIITDVNSATEKATGLPREKIIGTCFSEYFTDPEKARAGYKQVFDVGKVVDYELYLKHINGSSIPVLYNASVYKDNEGQIIGVFAAARDISAIKKHENELIDFENNLESIVQQKTAELIITNKELAFQTGEKADRAAELIIADKELAFQTGEKADRAAELVIADKELAFQTGEKADRAAELVIANRELIHQNVEKDKRAAELIIANKELVFQNEEKEKRAAELDATIAAVPDGLLINGPSEEIVHMNEAAVRLFGSTAEPSRSPMAERVAIGQFETPDGRPMPRDEFPPYRALRGETVVAEVFVFRSPAFPAQRWLSISSAPIRGNDGSLLGAVTVLRDTTDLHKLLEEREDMVRMVSHDLRSPLTVVQGQAQVIERVLKRSNQDPRLQRSAETIVTSTKRMNAMIQDLVDMAQVESRQLDLKCAPMEMRAFLLDLRQRLAGVLDTQRIRVEMPEESPLVSADPDRLERVFTNLLSNALKYSPPETEVVVTAEIQHGEVTVSVTDSGAGIAREELSHLFERFYRAKGTRKAEGLGLGLYITKMLVEAMGGRIWVESEVGKGSTFSFALPTRADC